MKMIVGALSMAFVLSPLAAAASTDDMGSFRPLAGGWKCAGSFAANGRPIEATVSVAWDAATESIFVRHDDLPPNGFHAVELWGKAHGGGYRASIADAYSGIRWLTSSGWAAGALEWTRMEAGIPVEKFRYSQVSATGFQLEWFVFDKDGQPKLGDSLQCRR